MGLVEFLECWKECRCLWDVEDKNYANRDRRNECYNVLLEIYKKKKTNTRCYRTIVIKKKKKKKTENIRAAHKREVRKVSR